MQAVKSLRKRTYNCQSNKLLIFYLKIQVTLKLLALSVIFTVIPEIKSHGRLIDPPARSSCWREFSQCPVEYTDNQMFCGGFQKQWEVNNGRCSICGVLKSFSNRIKSYRLT
jgi:hypothetical protein